MADAMVSLGAAVAGVRNAPLPKDLEGACRALEKEFALLVFRTMRKAMVPPGRGPDGFAKETAYGLLDDQWAELVSQGEGLGLWRSMMEQLERVKETGAGAEEKGREAEDRTEADPGRVAGPRPGPAGGYAPPARRPAARLDEAA
ncbi:hypothetical protein [Deferrisoma sp.]|nr:MAG: hypothetical protein D6708_17035 [Candidatus Dadabacteria bacterium]